MYVGRDAPNHYLKLTARENLRQRQALRAQVAATRVADHRTQAGHLARARRIHETPKASGGPTPMHVASSRLRSLSPTHVTSPPSALESSGCSRTVLPDVPCVRRMSRRASSPPSVRTLRHTTGSRLCGCHTGAIGVAARRRRPTLRSPSPRVGVPHWHEGTHRHAVPTRTS